MRTFSAIILGLISTLLSATIIPAAEPLATAEKSAEAPSGGQGEWVAVQEGTGGVTVDRVGCKSGIPGIRESGNLFS